MNRPLWIRLIAAAGILAGTLAIRADDPMKPDPRDAEIARLKAKVAEQSAEIGRLHADLEHLQSRQNYGTLRFVPPDVPPAPIPQRPDAQTSNRVPSDWQERQFNGMTYHIVPLAERERPSGPVIQRTLPPSLPAAAKRYGRGRTGPQDSAGRLTAGASRRTAESWPGC